MRIEDLLGDKKTTYSIMDEHNEKSSITIDKWVADLLQEVLQDVHSWIQQKYSLVCEKKPHLTRREKGDYIRHLASKEVEKHPNYKSMFDFL